MASSPEGEPRQEEQPNPVGPLYDNYNLDVKCAPQSRLRASLSKSYFLPVLPRTFPFSISESVKTGDMKVRCQ